MATGADFRNMTEGRMRCVDCLLEIRDWQMASYMMGHVLECALKAMICKNLGVIEYPSDVKRSINSTVVNFFRTHAFDQLSLLSGLSENTFSATNTQGAEFDNWSQFTFNYPSTWVEMRYETSQAKVFDETKAREMYNYLIGDTDSIINVIKRTWI